MVSFVSRMTYKLSILVAIRYEVSCLNKKSQRNNDNKIVESSVIIFSFALEAG